MSEGPGFVGIRFCQECNNMLYPKEDKANRVLLYACRWLAAGALITLTWPLSLPGIDEIVLIQELWFSSVSRLKLHLCEQNHPWDQWDGKHLYRCYPGQSQLSYKWYQTSSCNCELMFAPGSNHAPVRWPPLSPVSPQRGGLLPVWHQEGGGWHEALLRLHQHKLLSPLVWIKTGPSLKSSIF